MRCLCGAVPMDATYADPTFVFAAVVVFAAIFVRLGRFGPPPGAVVTT